MLNVSFSSNATCRFCGPGFPLTTAYSLELLFVHLFLEMFLYKVSGNCFKTVSLLCSPITGKRRYLFCRSVTQERLHEMFGEKMLKECRIFGLKNGRKNRHKKYLPE